MSIKFQMIANEDFEIRIILKKYFVSQLCVFLL